MGARARLSGVRCCRWRLLRRCATARIQDHGRFSRQCRFQPIGLRGHRSAHQAYAGPSRWSHCRNDTHLVRTSAAHRRTGTSLRLPPACRRGRVLKQLVAGPGVTSGAAGPHPELQGGLPPALGVSNPSIRAWGTLRRKAPCFSDLDSTAPLQACLCTASHGRGIVQGADGAKLPAFSARLLRATALPCFRRGLT